MRCSNCGKRINKKSSFCMACGAKVPRMPQIEKKKDKKKRRSGIKAAISLIAVFMIAVFSFLTFGSELVPEKVRNLKAYSWLSETVKDKLPDEIKLPFGLADKLPSDLPFDDLPERLSALPERLSDLPLLGFLSDDGDTAQTKKAGEGHAAHGEDAEENAGEEGSGSVRTAENHETGESKDVTESNDDGESRNSVPRSEEEKGFIAAGADNSLVLSGYNIYADIPTEWIRSNVRILEHRTDVDAGTDTVTLYLEMENRYINMTGTKEITYLYNEETGGWEAGPASKITCLTVEPATAEL